jgi:SAM-dependent methyltransferase
MITNPLMLCEAVDALLGLPRAAQPAAAADLAARIDLGVAEEDWNSRFGADSLFATWTGSELLKRLYAGNASTLRAHLRPGWRVVEVGGGDGRLWDQLGDLPEGGELVLIDPAPSTHDEVARRLPEGVSMTRVVGLAQDVIDRIPECDAVVCSLTLHHVAGRSAAERELHGLTGPGKQEVLEALRDAIRPRGGRLILNEADVHCEVDLAPGDPVLADRLFDSYVRRTAKALSAEIRGQRGDARRLGAIIQRWCLAQVALADAPLGERDVYELDISRWLELLAQAGLEVVESGFSDSELLFHRYVCR